MAQGAEADLSLADAVRAAGLPVHVIGDCQGIGYIEGALTDAVSVAAMI